MEIGMFILFLFISPFTVLLCKYSYDKMGLYAEGMFMGVHIPKEHAQNPEVQNICAKSKKTWNRYHRINLILGCVVCAVCFYSLELFVLVWMIWLFAYLGLLCWLVIAPHREMYRLKVRNHWFDTRTMHMVCIDTELAALSEKMAYSWKWHLPIAGILLLSGILVYRAGGWSDEKSAEWILFAAAVSITVVFLLFHLWLEKRQNVVYSQNTEVNFAVNQAVKRAWTASLLGADAVNGLAYLFLAVRFWQNQWLSGTDYTIYMVLQMGAAVALLIPILGIHKKKQRILQQDTEPIVVDDDEYWKNGWYYNPNDSHLLVQDRMCSMNFTFNMAKPAAWVFTGATAVLLVGVLVWTGSLILSFQNARVLFSMDGTQIQLEAAGYECSFDLKDVEAAELIEEMPEESFAKTNGGATEKYNIGYFRGRETGKCMMFLHNGYTPILKITLEDQVIFANSKEAGEAELWYEEIEKNIK